MMVKNLKIKVNKVKILAWYELSISTIITLFSIYSFIRYNLLPINFFVSIMGVLGGILLIRNSKKGFYLSIIWAVLQIFIVQIGELVINLSQGIFFTLAFLGFAEFETLPNVFFNPNLIGIVILIILIKWRRDILDKNEK